MIHQQVVNQRVNQRVNRLCHSVLKRETIPEWRKCDDRGECHGLVFTSFALSHLGIEDLILSLVKLVSWSVNKLLS